MECCVSSKMPLSPATDSSRNILQSSRPLRNITSGFARNRLIQSLGNYFPDAANFFEIGCGTGFVLRGVRETSPRIRLAGSEIFSDGLVVARAPLPEADLYQMD